LKKQILYARIGIVAASTLLDGFIGSKLYWNNANKQISKILDGAPVWENKFEVPELDKLYFFLDDDNHYEPSLYHHSK
jgi:hypothetical protein